MSTRRSLYTEITQNIYVDLVHFNFTSVAIGFVFLYYYLSVDLKLSVLVMRVSSCT